MNIVEQIYDQIVILTDLALGTGTYTRLRKVFNPEQNDFRNVNQAFGVRHGSASTADGVTRVYTMDHTFEVLLAKRASSRDTDLTIQETMNELYNKADEVFRTIHLRKLNLPSIVLIVDSPNIGEPEVLDNECVLLTLGFNVKYRSAII